MAKRGQDPQGRGSESMKNQIITKEDESVITLRNIGRRRFKVPLKPTDLTDIRNPDLVIEIVDILARNPDATEEEFSKSTQPFNRSLHLGRMLGLIDGKEVTNKGRALLELDSKRGMYGFLAIQLENSPEGRGFLEWTGESRITNSQSSRAIEFFEQRFPTMKEATRKQRASALSKLISTLAPHHPSNRKSENAPREEDEQVQLLKGEPYFEPRIIDEIDRLKIGTKVLKIPTGFMSAQGYDMVARNLKQAEIKILLGKDDHRGRAILADPLSDFRESVSSGIQSQQKRSAHMRLYKELVEGTARVKMVQPKMIDDLHGKGFFGDNRWAVPTSANLSRAGLERNIETAKSTCDPEDVEYFVEKFDGYWEEAEEITTKIIDEIVESWVYQSPVDSYLAYLRGLLETYGNLAADNIGKKYELATFQRMIVGSIIRSLRDRNAALVISPTGSGKTVMGSYTMAAVRDKFEKSVVIVPNEDLREKWETDGLSFGINSMIITTRKLQKEIDEFQNSKEGKNLHMFIDDKTLIVIDEAHKFRTEKSLGNIVLDRILSGEYNGKKPGVLLLTATPIGTGFENLQQLYALANLGAIPESIDDLSELPGFVNVTLPFIMDRFGQEDGDGHIGLSFGKKKMYYARRRQMIAPFNDDNEEIYRAINNLDFREVKEESTLVDFGIDIEPLTVDNMIFNRIGLASAVCSSQSAAIERIDNLLESIDERRYLDTQKIESQLLELRRLIKEERTDKIYEIALKILKNSNRKGIINVVNVKTREFLVERLAKDLGKNVVEYTGTTKEKKRIRELFAPKANNVRVLKRNQIDILVASGGASEGHDLQDAEFILNYDSWWTPLMLQQRMGRLDRPTDKPREFSVVNLVNINDSHMELVRMDEKLRERSKDLKGIIGDGAYEPIEDRNWENNENSDLGVVTVEIPEEELNLEIVTTSRHIADLADATNEDIESANRLPLGFESSTLGDESGTFVMLRHGSEIFTGFQHEDGMISYAPGSETYEKLLGLIRSEKGDASAKFPDNHLKSVELVIGGICELHGLDKSDIETIFSVTVLENDTTD